ncbi:MAG: PorV/PorQ family protein [Hymenobacter sp.]|nr:MAG: PorV/PorQ family protein [Hymenobacter sp.]
MKRNYLGLATLLGGFLGLSQAAQAQGSYLDDALLYSRQNPAGTARTLGLGGASASLGGDYGSMNTNPAGLGLYTKSEFTLTPGVGIGSANTGILANQASLGGSNVQQSANSFHIASLGLVFANRRADNDASSAWRGGSFALGFTRLADFNSGFRYSNTTDDAHSFYQVLREPGGYAQGAVLTPGYQATLTDIFNQYDSGTYTSLDGLAYGAHLTGQPEVRDANGNIVKGKDPDRSVAASVFSSFADAPGGLSEEFSEVSVSAGMEYWYNQQFALRMGYQYEHPDKGNRRYLTLGAGLKYNVFNMDFAYVVANVQKSPLANTLRFTLLFNFGEINN